MVEHILSASLEEGDAKRLSIEPIQLRPLLEELRQGVEIRSEKSVELECRCEADFIVNADRFHLSNILSTIIDNSVKYSAESVRIVVVAYKRAGQSVIEIEDNGEGIEPKHLKHIFEKFYRVPKGNVQDVRGFGLGLYYTKQIVERHGGRISASSRLREGTTIKIELPDVEETQ